MAGTAATMQSLLREEENQNLQARLYDQGQQENLGMMLQTAGGAPMWSQNIVQQVLGNTGGIGLTGPGALASSVQAAMRPSPLMPKTADTGVPLDDSIRRFVDVGKRTAKMGIKPLHMYPAGSVRGGKRRTPAAAAAIGGNVSGGTRHHRKLWEDRQHVRELNPHQLREVYRRLGNQPDVNYNVSRIKQELHEFGLLFLHGMRSLKEVMHKLLEMNWTRFTLDLVDTIAASGVPVVRLLYNEDLIKIPIVMPYQLVKVEFVITDQGKRMYRALLNGQELTDAYIFPVLPPDPYGNLRSPFSQLLADFMIRQFVLNTYCFATHQRAHPLLIAERELDRNLGRFTGAAMGMQQGLPGSRQQHQRHALDAGAAGRLLDQRELAGSSTGGPFGGGVGGVGTDGAGIGGFGAASDWCDPWSSAAAAGGAGSASGLFDVGEGGLGISGQFVAGGSGFLHQTLDLYRSHDMNQIRQLTDALNSTGGVLSQQQVSDTVMRIGSAASRAVTVEKLAALDQYVMKLDNGFHHARGLLPHAPGDIQFLLDWFEARVARVMHVPRQLAGDMATRWKPNEKLLRDEMDLTIKWWATQLRDICNMLLYEIYGTAETQLQLQEIEEHANDLSERQLKQLVQLAAEQQEAQQTIEWWTRYEEELRKQQEQQQQRDDGSLATQQDDSGPHDDRKMFGLLMRGFPGVQRSTMAEKQDKLLREWDEIANAEDEAQEEKRDNNEQKRNRKDRDEDQDNGNDNGENDDKLSKRNRKRKREEAAIPLVTATSTAAAATAATAAATTTPVDAMIESGEDPYLLRDEMFGSVDMNLSMEFGWTQQHLRRQEVKSAQETVQSIEATMAAESAVWKLELERKQRALQRMMLDETMLENGLGHLVDSISGMLPPPSRSLLQRGKQQQKQSQETAMADPGIQPPRKRPKLLASDAASGLQSSGDSLSSTDGGLGEAVARGAKTAADSTLPTQRPGNPQDFQYALDVGIFTDRMMETLDKSIKDKVPAKELLDPLYLAGLPRLPSQQDARATAARGLATQQTGGAASASQDEGKARAEGKTLPLSQQQMRELVEQSLGQLSALGIQVAPSRRPVPAPAGPQQRPRGGGGGGRQPAREPSDTFRQILDDVIQRRQRQAAGGLAPMDLS